MSIKSTAILCTFFYYNCMAKGLEIQATSIFKNGSKNDFVEWSDDREEPINAHDGCIIESKIRPKESVCI